MVESFSEALEFALEYIKNNSEVEYKDLIKATREQFEILGDYMILTACLMAFETSTLDLDEADFIRGLRRLEDFKSGYLTKALSALYQNYAENRAVMPPGGTKGGK